MEVKHGDLIPVPLLTLFSVYPLKRSYCFFLKARYFMFPWLCPRSVSKCHVKVTWLFSCSDNKKSHCDKHLYAFPFPVSDYLLIKAWTSRVTPFQLLSVTPALSALKESVSIPSLKIFSFSKANSSSLYSLSLTPLSVRSFTRLYLTPTLASCGMCHAQGSGWLLWSLTDRQRCKGNISHIFFFLSTCINFSIYLNIQNRLGIELLQSKLKQG